MSLKGNGNAIEIEELSRKKTPYKRVQGELNPADYNFVRLDEQHFVSLLCGKDGSFFSLLDESAAFTEVRRISGGEQNFCLVFTDEFERLSVGA